jgi:hypothetical protein
LALKTHPILFFCTILIGFLATFWVFGSGFSLAQRDQSKKSLALVSWAAPVGTQSLTFECLGGLQALLAFLNANDALGDQELHLFSLKIDDVHPEFVSRLSRLVENTNPVLAVGGAANSFPKATGDFFRRRGLVWYGPWADGEPLKSLSKNPILTLPTESQELKALWSYVRGQGLSQVAFIHLNGTNGLAAAAIAQQTADSLGLTLTTVAIKDSFREYLTLKPSLEAAQAIVLWLPPGQAAAIIRSLKPLLPPKVVWQTSAVNATGHELYMLSAGQWAGVIFPAVLKPKDFIDRGYDFVLQKYGPKGLDLDYHSYLGFAQGQLLARVFSQPADPKAYGRALATLDVAGTLLAANPKDDGTADFYLAESFGDGDWRRIQ